MISNNGLLTTVGYVFPGKEPVYALEGKPPAFLDLVQDRLQLQAPQLNGLETSLELSNPPMR